MPDAQGRELTAVFIDGQNAYMSARRLFFEPQYVPPDRPPAIYGQFSPMGLAELIVARNARTELSTRCTFTEVDRTVMPILEVTRRT